MKLRRRTLVRSLGSGIALGAATGSVAARENGRIERLLSTGSSFPENLAFDSGGNLYVGITGGSVRRLDVERTDETGLDIDATTEIATYPGGVFGTLVESGTLYAAVNDLSEGFSGPGAVYSLNLEGGEAEPREIASVPPDGDGFVNDLYADGDRLLATESFGGTVYEIPLDGGEPVDIWKRSELLTGEPFGANGLTRIGDDVFVNVTRATDDAGDSVGRIVRVPVEEDGSAGSEEAYLEGEGLFGVDGLTARGPQLYAAVNEEDRIVRVTPSQQVRTVVEGDPLVFPSEVVFDPTERGRMFVCNFAFGQNASEATGVLHTHP